MKNNPRYPSHRGFTLIEAIVVISIVAILVALLAGGINVGRKALRQNATHAFMANIQFAITGYARDHGAVPHSKPYMRLIPPGSVFGVPIQSYNPANPYTRWDGGELLAQALVGPLPEFEQSELPGDGKEGYGFRSQQGRIYGPYLQIKNELQLRARWDRNGNGVCDRDELYFESLTLQTRPGAYVLAMPYSRTDVPILYYRAESSRSTDADLTSPTPVWGTWIGRLSRFAVEDNKDLDGSFPGKTLYPGWSWWAYKASEESRQAFAIELRAADYMLYHAGADEEFGTADDIYVTGKN